MKLKLLFTTVVFCFSTAAFSGEGWNANNCGAKTAWFTKKMSTAVEVASLDSETLLKVDQLTSECHYRVSLGLSTYETGKCKEALELVGVN